MNPTDMYFIPLNNKNDLNRVGLRVYIENYNSDIEDDFLTATYLVLDNILGEKSNALDIGYVEIKD
ncbi:MAG: hypothetical protein EOO01_42765, partial [Chitinophagaceae bacterium]